MTHQHPKTPPVILVFLLALAGWLIWVNFADPPVNALMLHFLTHPSSR